MNIDSRGLIVYQWLSLSLSTQSIQRRDLNTEADLTWRSSPGFLSLSTWGSISMRPRTVQGHTTSAAPWGRSLCPCSQSHRTSNTSPLWSKRSPQTLKAMPLYWPFWQIPPLITRWAQALQISREPTPAWQLLYLAGNTDQRLLLYLWW